MSEIYRDSRDMRTAIKWSFLGVVAVLIAAVPTRLGSHDVAIGFPFTWHTRQEIITFGEQTHSFSSLLLLCDIAIALIVLTTLARLFRRRTNERVTPTT